MESLAELLEEHKISVFVKLIDEQDDRWIWIAVDEKKPDRDCVNGASPYDAVMKLLSAKNNQPKYTIMAS